MREIQVESTIDGTAQPSLYWEPQAGGPAQAPVPVPLVVGLHTWSYDRFNQRDNYLPLCRQHGFALLLPEFRGPNLAGTPRAAQACGSAVAVQDVLDAVEWVCARQPVDRGRVFLLGCSGGGHMALLAAAAAPSTFHAVELWCPVSDLAAWHQWLGGGSDELQRYQRDLEACLGGTPGERPDEYARRSPVSHAGRLRGLPVSIHHGKHDDVVPYRHSLELARRLEAAGNERVYLDVFDGGHEQLPAHSFEWFAKLAGAGAGAVGITG